MKTCHFSSRLICDIDSKEDHEYDKMQPQRDTSRLAQPAASEQNLVSKRTTRSIHNYRRETDNMDLLAPCRSQANNSNSPSLSAMERTQQKLHRDSNRYSSINNAPSKLQTKMYIPNKRAKLACHDAQQVNKSTVVNRMLRHRPRTEARGASLELLLSGLIVTLALSSCLLINQTSALEDNSQEASRTPSASPIPKSSSGSQEASNNRPNERADISPSKIDSSASSASSPQSSIVASLSSAVASAAAAAAVAAAQNSLSSNDARSLVSGSNHHNNHHHHGQTQRSPGLNLAIKLVDTIPEVPYNILHNMKKLDHAAPFYNVPNKLSGGSTKESSSPAQSFLTTALAASQGNFGGAAEQLSSLFKSPIWKRIADGYGDFASEFRSLFRAPGATPMKGPASPTSKLIRDISVPALLMLLASSISGEWRPVRTRRKSFRPVDISSGALQTGHEPQVSTPSFLADMKQPVNQYYQQYEQQQQQNAQARPQSFEQSYPSAPQSAAVNNFATSASGEWLDQQQQVNAGRQVLNNQQAQFGLPTVRINGDNNLHQSSRPTALDSLSANWISSMQAAPQSEPNSLIPNGGQDQQQQNFDLQQASSSISSSAYNQPQNQLQVAPVVRRRSDEILTPNGESKPTAAVAATHMLNPINLAALASVARGGKLISKLLNSNVATDGNSYRMMGLVNGDKTSSIKRDQLSDKQRYSLVGSDHGESPKQQTHILSAVAHAVTSMLHPTSVSGENVRSGSGASSGSALAASGASGSALGPALKGASNFLSRSNLQNLITGDKTINHEDSVFMRRQPQGGSQAEQRDLTKLLPEAWREVVKRTMTTVQQQANTQWKSIEGQLTNWVQDKLKTVAASASPASSGGSSNGSQPNGPLSGAVPAPLGNMLASMSSTALNILGLNKNNSSSSSGSTSANAATAATTVQASQAKSHSSGGDEHTATANQRGKLDQQTKPPHSSSQTASNRQPSKGALAGVASMIASTISNTSKQSSSPVSHLSHKPNQNNHADVAASSTHDKPQKTQTLGDLAASALASVTSVTSKYPTLTGTSQSESLDKSPAKQTHSSVLAGHSPPSVVETAPVSANEPTSSSSSSSSSSSRPLD